MDMEGVFIFLILLHVGLFLSFLILLFGKRSGMLGGLTISRMNSKKKRIEKLRSVLYG